MLFYYSQSSFLAREEWQTRLAFQRHLALRGRRVYSSADAATSTGVDEQ
jgi:hypothetical protein